MSEQPAISIDDELLSLKPAADAPKKKGKPGPKKGPGRPPKKAKEPVEREPAPPMPDEEALMQDALL
ncbi:hypothetical protein U2088_15540, partial [Listeria monocytogenes]|uniref:hypothetical protein n=1 Tax=Listeria monocytogenes TaxID=1639 RepID=UPI002FDBDA21